MRAILSKEIKKQFDEAIKRRWPEFKRHRGTNWYSSVVYENTAQTPPLFLVLDVLGKRQRERFKVVAAWSTRKDFASVFPNDMHGNSMMQGEPRFDVTRDGEMIILGPRVPGAGTCWDLSPRASMSANWNEWSAWPPPIEDVLPKVRPAIEDAVARIEHEAIPFFSKIVKLFGA